MSFTSTISGVISGYRPPVPPPPPPPPPAPTPIATGINVQAISQEVYGQVIPISLGGRRRMGGTFVWGPKVTDAVVNGVYKRTASFAVSFGFSADPDGVRDVLEIRLDTRVAYSKIRAIPTMAGLTWRFYQGTETQEPDSLAIAEHGSAANAFRGQMILFFENLPLEAFGNVIPFVSALICDSISSSTEVNTYTGGSGLNAIQSYAAVDWRSGVFFTWLGSGPNATFMQCHRISDRSLIYQIQLTGTPMTLLADSMHETLWVFCSELQCIIASCNIGGGSERILLVNPYSVSIFASSGSYPGILGAPSAYWMVNGTDLYLATVDRFSHRFNVHKYVNGSATISAWFTSANNYDGLGGGTDRGMVKSPVATANPTFYVASDTKLIKYELTPNSSTTGTATGSVVYTAVTTINNLYDDPSTGRLILFLSDSTAISLDPATLTAAWTKDLSFTISAPEAFGNRYGNMSGWRKTRPYFAWYEETGLLTIVNLTDGSESSTVISSTAGHVVFDTESSLVIVTDFTNPRDFRLTGSSIDTILKSDALELLAGFFGYEADEFEAVGVTGTWIAIIIAYETTFQDLIKNIADLEGWEIIESGDKLKVVQPTLGDAIEVDYVIQDKDIERDKDGSAEVQVHNEEDVELPRQLEFVFIDPARDYNWNLAPYKFARDPVSVTASVSNRQIKLAIVMSMDQAMLTIAAKAHRDRAARQKYSFRGMPSTHRIEPGDVITIPTGMGTVTAMVQTTDFGAEWSNRISAKKLLSRGPINDSSFWVPGVVPSDSGVVDTPIISSPDATLVPFYLDLPLLGWDDDAVPSIWDVMRLYAAVGTRGETFYGGYLIVKHASMDVPGVVLNAPTAPLCGTAMAVLGTTTTPFQTDYANSLRVSPMFGDWTAIVDKTYLQMCNEEQLFAIGQAGRWEVVSVAGVTDNGDGTFTLDTFIRGMYGTERNVGTHQAGDFVVRITGRNTDWDTVSPTNVWKRSMFESLLGEPISFQAVPYTADLSSFPVGDYPVYTTTVTANAEKPWAPCHLDADVSGSDVLLTWDRRDRLDEEGLHDSSDTVPLSEATEQYKVEIYDGSTLKRTYSNVTTDSKTYPAADIATDFGSIPSSIRFKVCQVSADVGDGFFGDATIQLSA